jgi:protease-4
MKSFLKFTFAAVLGTLISFLLFLFISIGIISGIASKSEPIVQVKDKTVLIVNLNQPIVEREPINPFKGFSFGDKESDPKAGSLSGLDRILKSIEAAKTDSKIQGIYLNTSYFAGGLASLEEIRNALLDFKESGKFIYSYSEIYSQSAYYLATVADKIYINPEGMLEFKGLNMDVLFFKNALEKLEVDMQIIRGRDNKFKSAVEPFMYEKMSDSNREQMTKLSSSIWNSLLINISKSRNIPIEDLQKYADKLVSNDLSKAKEFNLVDDLFYQDQVTKDLKEKLELKESESVYFLSLSKYNSTVKNEIAPRDQRVAVIYANGEIQSGQGNDDIIGSDRIAKAIREAREDESVKSVVLRVNSPGGSALASEVMWRELVLLKEKKPLVVSMGNYAASGGYYIACMADEIYAEANTITGSIGVFGMFPNAKEMLNNKLGITFDGVKTAENADILSPYKALTEFQINVIRDGVEKIYDTFLQHVADGRDMTVEEVDSIGQGRVWTGTDALKLGLVDKIGNLEDAIAKAAEMASLTDYRIHELPKQINPFDELMKSFEGQVKTNIIKNELGTTYKYYQYLKNISGMQGYQTRMPYFLEIN